MTLEFGIRSKVLCPRRYRKATHGAGPKDPSLISHRHSMSVCESTPGTPVAFSAAGAGELKVLSPELRRCQQQHIGRPEVRSCYIVGHTTYQDEHKYNVY